MAESDTQILAKIHPSIKGVDAAAWDALAGSDDPFLRHAFYRLLETSGSVGEGTGWSPLYVTVERDGALRAAAPAFLKSHSQGEYVFDHAWADAWHRAGGDYYPKLQLSVPFTPCPGPRLLGSDTAALIAALETVTRQNNLSSAHATFLEDADIAAFEACDWLIRDGIQFHWFNRDYASFEDFLAALSSRKRKAIRKERARAVEGLAIETLRGAAINEEAIDAMWLFYQDTGARKWGQPYLTRGFFDGLVDTFGDSALMFLARRDGVPVAGALNIIGDDVLYGRYWGCSEELPFLHFELSYYRAMEWAIENKIAVVQAGAQGEHKLKRGYEPVITRSAHYIPHREFRDAIERFVEGERAAISREMEWAREALPFRQD